jgi:hypothetical protein
MTPDSPNSRNEGASTLDGQLLTQRWHAVHIDVKRAILSEPGGDTGHVTASGIFVGLLWIIDFVGSIRPVSPRR